MRAAGWRGEAALAGRILRTAIAPHLAPGVILRGGRTLPLRRAAYYAVEPADKTTASGNQARETSAHDWAGDSAQ